MRRPATLIILLGAILASGTPFAQGDTINQLAENVADFPESFQVVNSERNSFGIVTQKLMILPTEKPVLVLRSNMDDGGVLAGYDYGTYTGSRLDGKYKEERLKALLSIQSANRFIYFGEGQTNRELQLSRSKDWLGKDKKLEFNVLFRTSTFEGYSTDELDFLKGTRSGPPVFRDVRRWHCQVEVSRSYKVKDISCADRLIYPVDKAALIGWDILEDISFRAFMHPYRGHWMRLVDIRMPASVQEGRVLVDQRLPPGVTTFVGSPRSQFMSNTPTRKSLYY